MSYLSLLLVFLLFYGVDTIMFSLGNKRRRMFFFALLIHYLNDMLLFFYLYESTVERAASPGMLDSATTSKHYPRHTFDIWGDSTLPTVPLFRGLTGP
jgi:hypothetical protein